MLVFFPSQILTSIRSIHVERVLSIQNGTLQADALRLHPAGVGGELGQHILLAARVLRHRLHHHLRRLDVRNVGDRFGA